jgi:hypothetical protein
VAVTDDERLHRLQAHVRRNGFELLQLPDGIVLYDQTAAVLGASPVDLDTAELILYGVPPVDGGVPEQV